MISILAGLLAWASAAHGGPRVSIVLDPRIELLEVIGALADGDRPLDGPFWSSYAYAADVKAHFGKFRAHPAVQAYRKARGAGQTSVGAQQQMMDLGPPPQLKRNRETWKGPEIALKPLRAFAAESDFMGFYGRQAPVYRDLVEAASRELRDPDVAAPLERYSSMKVTAACTVLLCPLRRGQDANLNHIECLDGGVGYRVVSTVGPDEIAKGRPVFRLGSRRWDLWHEMGHGLLDRLLESHPAEVGASEGLYGGFPAGCHGSWDQCLREHVAQGVATRLLEIENAAGGAPSGEPIFRRELELLPLVMEQLKIFESDRGRFKTLADFYPALLGAFVARARSLPRSGGGPRGPRPVLPASSDCGGRRGEGLR